MFERSTEMKPGTVWIAIMLLALGVCGILDAAGVVDSSQTIGQWWPLAVVGWAITDMLAARRVTLGAVICAAIGVTLLADAQAWVGDTLLWSSLAVFIGLALLVGPAFSREDREGRGGACSSIGGGES
jgi:LiaF transmembrane domain